MQDMKNKKINTPKKNELFNAWLDKNIKLLVELYGIGNVTLMINDFSHASTAGRKGGDVLFRINYSAPYRTANIWYYQKTVDLFNKKNFPVLRQAITHEIAHILTNPLSELAIDRFISRREIDDCVENLTETIGQLCRKLLEAKKIEMM